MALEIDMGEVCSWARESGEVARAYFNTLQGERKPDHSLVSRADLEIEQLLRERIQKRYPGHGILGEEQGGQSLESEYVWCLDPIDGTECFLAGLPVWGISIGLLAQKQLYRGVVYLPTTDDCYWNEAADKAYWNGKPIYASKAETLTADDWLLIPSRAHEQYTLSFPCKARSYGSLATHCCYVARNVAPAALLGRPKLWDIAAGLAILGAAGGAAVLLPSGQPLDVTALLAGKPLKEPLIACPPAFVGQLTTWIRERGGKLDRLPVITGEL